MSWGLATECIVFAVFFSGSRKGPSLIVQVETVGCGSCSQRQSCCPDRGTRGPGISMRFRQEKYPALSWVDRGSSAGGTTREKASSKLNRAGDTRDKGKLFPRHGLIVGLGSTELMEPSLEDILPALDKVLSNLVWWCGQAYSGQGDLKFLLALMTLLPTSFCLWNAGMARSFYLSLIEGGSQLNYS